MEFCAEARKPLSLFGLGAKFVEIEKLPERLIAGEPNLLVKDVRRDRRRGELQVDARILAQRAKALIDTTGAILDQYLL